MTYLFHIIVLLMLRFQFLRAGGSGIITFLNFSTSTGTTKLFENCTVNQSHVQPSSMCDITLQICIGKITLSRNCFYGQGVKDFRVDVSNNSIIFGSFIGTLKDSFVYHFDVWKFGVAVDINVSTTGSAPIDIITFNLYSRPAPNGQVLLGIPTQYSGKQTSVTVVHSVACDPFYFDDCDVFCLPDPTQYTCDSNGSKICLPGINCGTLGKTISNSASTLDTINNYVTSDTRLSTTTDIHAKTDIVTTSSATDSVSSSEITSVDETYSQNYFQDTEKPLTKDKIESTSAIFPLSNVLSSSISTITEETAAASSSNALESSSISPIEEATTNESPIFTTTDSNEVSTDCTFQETISNGMLENTSLQPTEITVDNASHSSPSVPNNNKTRQSTLSDTTSSLGNQFTSEELRTQSSEAERIPSDGNQNSWLTNAATDKSVQFSSTIHNNYIPDLISAEVTSEPSKSVSALTEKSSFLATTPQFSTKDDDNVSALTTGTHPETEISTIRKHTSNLFNTLHASSTQRTTFDKNETNLSQTTSSIKEVSTPESPVLTAPDSGYTSLTPRSREVSTPVATESPVSTAPDSGYTSLTPKSREVSTPESPVSTAPDSGYTNLTPKSREVSTPESPVSTAPDSGYTNLTPRSREVSTPESPVSTASDSEYTSLTPRSREVSTPVATESPVSTAPDSGYTNLPQRSTSLLQLLLTDTLSTKESVHSEAFLETTASQPSETRIDPSRTMSFLLSTGFISTLSPKTFTNEDTSTHSRSTPSNVASNSSPSFSNLNITLGISEVPLSETVKSVSGYLTDSPSPWTTERAKASDTQTTVSLLSTQKHSNTLLLSSTSHSSERTTVKPDSGITHGLISKFASKTSNPLGSSSSAEYTLSPTRKNMKSSEEVPSLNNVSTVTKMDEKNFITTTNEDFTKHTTTALRHDHHTLIPSTDPYNGEGDTTPPTTPTKVRPTIVTVTASKATSVGSTSCSYSVVNPGGGTAMLTLYISSSKADVSFVSIQKTVVQLLASSGHKVDTRAVMVTKSSSNGAIRLNISIDDPYHALENKTLSTVADKLCKGTSSFLFQTPSPLPEDSEADDQTATLAGVLAAVLYLLLIFIIGVILVRKKYRERNKISERPLSEVSKITGTTELLSERPDTSLTEFLSERAESTC